MQDRLRYRIWSGVLLLSFLMIGAAIPCTAVQNTYYKTPDKMVSTGMSELVDTSKPDSLQYYANEWTKNYTVLWSMEIIPASTSHSAGTASSQYAGYILSYDTATKTMEGAGTEYSPGRTDRGSISVGQVSPDLLRKRGSSDAEILLNIPKSSIRLSVQEGTRLVSYEYSIIKATMDGEFYGKSKTAPAGGECILTMAVSRPSGVVDDETDMDWVDEK